VGHSWLGRRTGSHEPEILGCLLGAGYPGRHDEAASARREAQGFNLQPYYGGTLFKQGTELVAMQRGNLEMGNIAPQDISNQIPEWSIVTSAYLFRDADHLKKVFASDVGQQLKKMASDKLGIHISAPPISAPGMWV
jgi:TRAP-type C4-dicarboxylate transport system substrate-binding protein